MNSHSECSAGDAAAYVLGALEPYELEPFRYHLSSCAICRDEVAALQVVADMLPSAVAPTAAPRALRKRVLSTVYDEARLFEAATNRRRDSGLSSRLRSAAAIFRPVPTIGAVACLAIGIVVGAVGLGGGGSSGPSTRVVPGAVANSGGAALTTAEVRITGSRAELVVAGMAPLPAGQVYEVWLQRGARTDRTNALFTPTTNGSADVDIPGDVKGVSTVMVTAEPAGGTDHPTTLPVIRASLD
jgi:anti-sigma-K factor RskA